MAELFVALGVGLLLLLAGWASASLANGAGFVVGFWLIVVGLGIGLPGGIAYHVALFRAVRSVTSVPARWWVAPHRLHRLLSGTARSRVLTLFAVGAVGFSVVVTGIVLVACATWREMR